MPTPLLPDALAVAQQALLAQQALVTLVGQRVYVKRPAEPTWPLLQLSVVDDREREWYSGEARVQVDVWGAGSADADVAQVGLIVRTLVSVTRDLVGAWPAGSISNAAVESAVPQPDPVTGRFRIAVDLTVWTHS